MKLFWKTRLGSFFKFYFHIFKTHARFQKFPKTNFTWVLNNSLVTSSYDGSLVDAVYWKTSKQKSSRLVSSTNPIDSIIGCKWWWHFKSIGYKVLLSYSSTIFTPSSWPTKEDIRQRLLKLWSNVKNMLWFFLFSNFLLKKEKIPKYHKLLF